ncbi:2'-5' RNA ligase family protein [Sphingomonas sp. NFR15]|uniref:2'-5' RNA ligase family protein n=1 Tax=Sphingomonas sp. NFR15 TaxID=1566282 RepID=UPI000891B021|nr:2'-5' RNA ligase family protein [Sphingomonas sp. NFR15]SDA29248.1 2'-5' RNA ligase superfamily protein [Sphingomonas sp. NFR15]
MIEPAPIIVTALFGKTDAAVFDGLRQRHFPPERNHLAAHLTMFHHLPPSISAELKQRLSAATRGVAPPDARIAGLMSLGGGVAFRIESASLEDIRESLADAFAPLLTPQDRAGWRPHVTIQNKVSSTEAKALLAALETDFRPRSVVIAGLASWYYRGGPWEPLSRHMFA